MHVLKQCGSNLKVGVRLIIECASQSGKYSTQTDKSVNQVYIMDLMVHVHNVSA